MISRAVAGETVSAARTIGELPVISPLVSAPKSTDLGWMTVLMTVPLLASPAVDSAGAKAAGASSVSAGAGSAQGGFENPTTA